MEILDVLSVDCTACAIHTSNKKKILESIGRLAGNKIGYIDTTTIMASIVEREKKGSTGIGQGIAIPHGRITGLEKAVAVLVTTQQAIPFDAIDNKPVDVFFALLVAAGCPFKPLMTTLDKVSHLLAVSASKNNSRFEAAEPELATSQ